MKDGLIKILFLSYTIKIDKTKDEKSFTEMYWARE
jgi:hypothetical protein